LVNRATVFLGKISYSLYLNHPIAIVALLPYYTIIYSLPVRSTIKYGICALLTLGVVVIVSIITYNLIEKPGMRLGTHITRNLKTKANQVSKTEFLGIK